MNLDKLNNTQIALYTLAVAVIDTVKETGDRGAPLGPMYAAFMDHNISLETFEAVVKLVVDKGILQRRGNCLYPNPNPTA
jgi:hypothetical protein